MELDVLEITKGRVFKVWWRLVWRFYLFGALVIFLLEGLSFGSAILLGDDVSEVTIVVFKGLQGLITGAALILVSIAVLQHVLKKKFSDFEIVLVARDNQRSKDQQKQ